MMGWWERVEDGTCSQVASVEYRGQDTSTQGEAGNNKLIATSLPEISLPPDSELSFLPTLREFSLAPLPPPWAEYSSHPSDTSDHVQPDDDV